MYDDVKCELSSAESRLALLPLQVGVETLVTVKGGRYSYDTPSLSKFKDLIIFNSDNGGIGRIVVPSIETLQLAIDQLLPREITHWETARKEEYLNKVSMILDAYKNFLD